MTPEFDITFRIDTEKIDNIDSFSEHVKEIAGQHKLSIINVNSEITQPSFDAGVKTLYLSQEDTLETQQIAESLGVSTSRVNKSISLLRTNGEIKSRRQIKNKLLDNKVKSLYLSQEDPLKVKQITETLGLSNSRVITSLSRLRENGEIKSRKQTINDNLDSKVKTLYLSEEIPLKTQQIAEILEITPYKVRTTHRRLRLNGEIKSRNDIKYDVINKKVKQLFLNEDRYLTRVQMAEKLNISPDVLNNSIKKLKNNGEIDSRRKRRFYKSVVRQELREFIELNPDSHCSLNEITKRLKVKVTRERIRVLLIDLKREGYPYETFKQHSKKSKAKYKEQRLLKIEKRREIYDTTRDLITNNIKVSEVERIIKKQYGDDINIQSVLNFLRKKEELPRVRKIRRNKSKIAEMDNKVIELYMKKLSNSKILKITGLDRYQFANSLYRLRKDGKITRRKIRSKNEK